jgi:hypothetical protein
LMSVHANETFHLSCAWAWSLNESHTTVAGQCPSGEDPMLGKGASEGRECSGRGQCNGSSGVCKCFKGFKGEACNQLTTFV